MRSRTRTRRTRIPASARAAWTSTSNGVVWAALASGHHGQLRPKPLQRSSERTRRGDRPGLPGRLEALHHSRVRSLRACRWRTAAPKRPITIGSISSTRSVSARTRRSRPAIESDALFALVDAKWVTMRVPYPMGYLCQGHGRPHRRRQHRLEGQGNLLDLFGPLRAAYRRRQGTERRSCTSRFARSAGELNQMLRCRLAA